MAYIKIWVHVVWSVKKRQKLITKDLRPKLLEHIKRNAREKNIFIEEVNCVSDHVHLLVSLGAKQTISDVVRLLKGEASHWLNKQMRIRFSWQEEYFAVSVSESALGKVKEYIRNQEEHHRKKSFAEEVEEFRKRYGFKLEDDLG